ncbi:MAG: type II secretion system F family protein [Planctomycetota bacterium]
MVYVILLLVIAFFVWVTLSLNHRSLVWERLNADEPSGADEQPVNGRDRDPDPNVLSAWLYRAGYRRPFAVAVFIVTTLLAVAAAVGLVLFFRGQGVTERTVNMLTNIPGGVGNVMVPFALALPWFLVAVLSLLPTLVVRAARRRRVESVQQDLPLLLDLLNTLAQAGIGFDAALERILSVQPPDRPLVQDFRLFQRDALAGRSRVDSLRRLMRRVSVPMFSSFISALIQAEQSGGGMATTMRVQAVEVRRRRRERASAIAMAVPTKLVVPMVIGFLPGIFVVLLGPMINEAFGMMDQMTLGVGGQ